MAKVTRIKFLSNYFDAGEVKYAQGEHYPKTDETYSQVLAGHAEEIEVEMDAAAAAANSAAVRETAAAKAKTEAANAARATSK